VPLRAQVPAHQGRQPAKGFSFGNPLQAAARNEIDCRHDKLHRNPRAKSSFAARSTTKPENRKKNCLRLVRRAQNMRCISAMKHA
ncbi:MAG: hypothetical protein ACREV2_14085, partial [Burkholderiales bacterium]